MVKPFKVNISAKTIQDINSKVKKYQWNDMANIDSWQYGTNITYMKEISNYWIKDFNWKKHEKEINKFSNFTTKVGDTKIHFILEKGSGSNSTPLLLMHGWPGSIFEFLHIIEKLAHPEKFGGKEEDAFDVIIPSLPGFGFSEKPTLPMGPRKIAKVLNELMIKNIGYKKYLAQGGDWGATICNWLAYDHPQSCKGIHINCLTMRHPDGPKTQEEKDWQIKFDQDQIMEDGYRTQQATKPQTLSYSMMDSPVGVAAWILEKMYFWSDLKNKDLESVYSKDILLANIMVYIVTKTFNTASWIYYGRREEGGRYFPKDFKKIQTPTGIAMFPSEMSTWPPQSYLDRMFNVKQLTKMSKGGHFAAMEQPDLLTQDVVKFAKIIR